MIVKAVFRINSAPLYGSDGFVSRWAEFCIQVVYYVRQILIDNEK